MRGKQNRRFVVIDGYSLPLFFIDRKCQFSEGRNAEVNYAVDRPLAQPVP